MARRIVLEKVHEVAFQPGRQFANSGVGFIAQPNAANPICSTGPDLARFPGELMAPHHLDKTSSRRC